MTPTLSRRIAQWSLGDDIRSLPASGTALIKRAFLDTLAVTVLGARLSGPRIVARIESARGGTPVASVHGMGCRLDPIGAALVNGTSAHAELFDDNSVPMIAHPSSPLVSALLPLAQEQRASGRELIEAYGVGFEVGVALGRLVNPELYERGWHVTRVLGVIGATAACCRLLALDVDRTTAALGIAATMAGGLRQNFGTMTMGMHVGLTARDAVHATLLAQAGMTADAAALDGRYGFFAAFVGKVPVAPLLGQPFELIESGITFKPYPSGAPTHAAVDAALAIRAEPGFDPALISRVRCLVHPWNAMTLRGEIPRDTLQARVSMSYCIAAALRYGELGHRQFDPTAVADAQVAGLMERIIVEVDGNMPNNGEFPAELQVETSDGKVRIQKREVPPGGSSRPLSDDDVTAKFKLCAQENLSHDAIALVLGMVLHLESLPDAAALCCTLESTSRTEKRA